MTNQEGPPQPTLAEEGAWSGRTVFRPSPVVKGVHPPNIRANKTGGVWYATNSESEGTPPQSLSEILDILDLLSKDNLPNFPNCSYSYFDVKDLLQVVHSIFFGETGGLKSQSLKDMHLTEGDFATLQQLLLYLPVTIDSQVQLIKKVKLTFSKKGREKVVLKSIEEFIDFFIKFVGDYYANNLARRMGSTTDLNERDWKVSNAFRYDNYKTTYSSEHIQNAVNAWRAWRDSNGEFTPVVLTSKEGEERRLETPISLALFLSNAAKCRPKKPRKPRTKNKIND